MRSLLLITVAFVACNASLNAPDRRRPLAARRRAIDPTARVDHLAARRAEPKPHGWLPAAYSACGLATTAAWSRIVFTTIRSNQPLGMMMPTYQHGLFARTSAMSAAPVIVSCFAASGGGAAERGTSAPPAPGCPIGVAQDLRRLRRLRRLQPLQPLQPLRRPALFRSAPAAPAAPAAPTAPAASAAAWIPRDAG